jgi:hypothetical protein
MHGICRPLRLFHSHRSISPSRLPLKSAQPRFSPQGHLSPTLFAEFKPATVITESYLCPDRIPTANETTGSDSRQTVRFVEAGSSAFDQSPRRPSLAPLTALSRGSTNLSPGKPNIHRQPLNPRRHTGVETGSFIQPSEPSSLRTPEGPEDRNGLGHVIPS